MANVILNGDFSDQFNHWINGGTNYPFVWDAGRAKASSFPTSNTEKKHDIYQAFVMNDIVLEAHITAWRGYEAKAGSEANGMVRSRISLVKPNGDGLALAYEEKVAEIGEGYILSNVNIPISEFAQQGNYKLYLESQVTSAKNSNVGINWQDLGQQDGQTRITGLAHNGAGIVIAVGGVADGQPNGGHIFRSVDGGESFQDLGQQYGQTRIHCVIFCANGVFLAGTSQGMILKSTDNGATWDLIDPGIECNIYCMAYLGSNVVAAGDVSAGKILRSGDKGDNWTDLGTQYGQDYIWCMDAAAPGIAYAGTGDGGLILKTEDYAENWQNLGQQFGMERVTGIACHSAQDGRILAGGSPGARIIRSETWGETWESIGQYDNYAIFGPCWITDQIVIAGTGEDGKILYSNSDGKSWQDLGRQYDQVDIRALCSPSNEVALVGTYPDGKILLSIGTAYEYSQSYGYWDNITLDIKSKVTKVIFEPLEVVETEASGENLSIIHKTISEILEFFESTFRFIKKTIKEDLEMKEYFPQERKGIKEDIEMEENLSTIKRFTKQELSELCLSEKLQAKKTAGNLETTYLLGESTEWEPVAPTVTPWIKSKTILG